MSVNNPLVDPLLTDLYQLTMAYGYWKNGAQDRRAVFDLFFRRCPFGGEFAVFAGLGQALDFLESFRFDRGHLDYLRGLPEFADKEAAFFDWLAGLDAGGVAVYAQPEGNLAFPRVPLLRVEGPLGVCQLLETTLLSLVNYASLVATNAARYRLAAGWDKRLLEFGLRRAQGPDGGVSASLYSYLGGFDATSNVKAGQLFGMPVAGTHAHAFVESFGGLGDLPAGAGPLDAGRPGSFRDAVLAWRERLGHTRTNEGELAAFIAYAQAFPDQFLALVDTYATIESGVPNFVCVAAALFERGRLPRGIRLDSGDLAYLSVAAAELFADAGRRSGFDFGQCRITASNDINEGILLALRRQEHRIDSFGIGTNLVTCESQPAFGGVYKLVAIDGRARIKLSDNSAKITIPGRKRAWRLFGRDGTALADLLCADGEAAPAPGAAIECRHPFDPVKRVQIIPHAVVDLLPCAWDGRRLSPPEPLEERRGRVAAQLKSGLRPDQLRAENPAGYKVSLSPRLFEQTQELIARESMLRTIS